MTNSSSTSTSTTTSAPLVPAKFYRYSHTINTWCALRCADLVDLKTHGVSYDERPIYHYLNHPIRYIKLLGLIVCIETYARRRIYTIDDSSGYCIECAALLPLPSQTTGAPPPPPSSSTSSRPAIDHAINNPEINWERMEECTPVRITGIMGNYMGQPQIQIMKMMVIPSTDMERIWWDECSLLKSPEGALGSPWNVSSETIDKWERRERKRKAKEREKGRGGGMDRDRAREESGSSRRTEDRNSRQREREREHARKREPRETSPNKPIPQPKPKQPIKKRIIPVALADLSGYETFGV